MSFYIGGFFQIIDLCMSWLQCWWKMLLRLQSERFEHRQELLGSEFRKTLIFFIVFVFMVMRKNWRIKDSSIQLTKYLFEKNHNQSTFPFDFNIQHNYKSQNLIMMVYKIYIIIIYNISNIIYEPFRLQLYLLWK